MLVSLYNGNIHIWNHETQQLIKTFEICELPVRAAKFVPRKNWIITGSVSVSSWSEMCCRLGHSHQYWIFKDDNQIRVFNYNTLERVHMFEAHSDYFRFDIYLRSIAVHPTQPYVLTTSGTFYFYPSIFLLPKDSKILENIQCRGIFKTFLARLLLVVLNECGKILGDHLCDNPHLFSENSLKMITKMIQREIRLQKTFNWDRLRNSFSL